MSADVKLSSKLAADPENNGLDHWAEELTEQPERLIGCYVLVDVESIRDITDTGKRIPTVRVRRIEPLGPADEISTAIRKLAEKAQQDRTGRVPLPFDQVAEDAAAVKVTGPLEETADDTTQED